MSTTPRDPADPFDGPGEMRERGRAFDWAATSLGPVATWSPALRAVVRTCLESPFPVNLWCGPDRLLVYNDGYRRVLGAKHPAALGRPGLEVWAEIADSLRPMFAHIDAGGAPVFAEDAHFVMSRGDGGGGEDAYFTFGLSAVRDDAGDIVAYFNPAAESTARVVAERELDAIRRRLDAALLAGEVGTFQWDIADDRVFGDRNFSRIFSIALDDTGAAPIADYLAAIHPDDRARVVALIERTIETGAPYEAEYRLVTGPPDARVERWVEARGRIEYDAAGTPVRFPGVVQDVTRRRAAEEERVRLLATAEAARREAEVANRAKSDFLASMSHELRTPLNAIGGHTQLLEMELHGPLTDAQRATLARVDRAQRHLLGLINDILNYAKLESGSIEYALRPVALREVVDDVLPIVEPLIGARGHELELLLEPVPPVVADREKLAQVLINLVSNAAKFTPDGGRIAIAAECAPADAGRVLVHVRDTGIGIPAAQLEAIFEPFVQVRRRPGSSEAKTEGTGLGLTISRDLARGMGGELTVRSVERHGTTFTLSLAVA